MCTNLLLAVPDVEAAADSGGDPPRLFVSARCMELPGVAEMSVYVVAQGQDFPLRKPPPPFVTDPAHWTATYGFVGIAPSGRILKPGLYSSEMVWDVLPTVNDGINTEGLSIGALWFSPGATYPSAADAIHPQVSFFDFPAWVLGTCATVDDVRTALLGPTATVSVVGPPAVTTTGPARPDHLYVPLHYVLTDSTGASIVVEFIEGRTVVYDGDRAVLTNAPSYEWHRENVKNYHHLSPVSSATSTNMEGPPTGAGFQGLPGDPTSASRFVKAWCLLDGYRLLPEDGMGWLPAPGGATGFSDSEQTAVTTAIQLVQLAMGTPYGIMVEPGQTTPPAMTFADYTMWTSARDHTNVNYYFVPAFSGVLTKIDLSAIDFGSAPTYPHNLTIPVMPQSSSWYSDATDTLAPARDDIVRV